MAMSRYSSKFFASSGKGGGISLASPLGKRNSLENSLHPDDVTGGPSVDVDPGVLFNLLEENADRVSGPVAPMCFTPLELQVLDLKDSHPDCILFVECMLSARMIPYLLSHFLVLSLLCRWIPISFLR